MWTKHVSSSGRPYYYNSSLQLSLWQPPADAIVHIAQATAPADVKQDSMNNSAYEAFIATNFNSQINESHMASNLNSQINESCSTLCESKDENYQLSQNSHSSIAGYYSILKFLVNFTFISFYTNN